MRKRLVMLVTIFLLLAVFIAGCDATGSLSKKEEESLMDFLVAEDYIDDKVELLTDGVGEGELHLFYNDVFVDGDACVLNIQQVIREDEYRVFSVSIKDEEENEIEKLEVKIDRETSKVSLYEEK